MSRTADPATELSSCCNAPATYDGDGMLYCKKCYETLTWEKDPVRPSVSTPSVPPSGST